MKVAISVGGRFHAFYLAQQLLKRGYLKKLITSYPKFEVAKYGIPKDKVGTVIIKELISRSWEKAPLFLKNSYNPQYLIHEIYDRWASHLYDKSDICVAWSSFGLHTIRKAKEMGAITIIERGSSHMLYQQAILRDEFEKFGLEAQLPHPEIVEKELQEYKEADFISVPSIFVKRTFIEKGIPESKLIHVPYGVDLSEFKQIPREDKTFRIIHCGGITLRKGVHYLLQVFCELNLPNAELWLIGATSDEIKPFLKSYDNGRIFHKGPYPQKELYKYYSQGSIFVIMSIEEGLAIVQPQAMACGLPVICTTNTGGEDIVRNGIDGYIIPIRDVDALKERLVYLHGHPDICREMGQSAKLKVSSGFTWDDYGKKICREYEQLVRTRKAK